MTSTTLYTREEAVAHALATSRNVPNTCQLVTRGWLGAPSAGDFDGDGASDAEDGWKREPAASRHTDRKPPAGTPVAYLGGSHDNGHRALSLGPDKNGVYHIRSTDAAGLGHVATVPLDWPEKAWGLSYAGWSETCDGVPIKPSAKKPRKPLDSRGERVDEAIRLLTQAASHAKAGTPRAKQLKQLVKDAQKLPFIARKK